MQDIRQLNIGAGKVRQEFPDVSAQIQPQTVSFSASGTESVEQNFDYDLLSPNALMDKAVGETVTQIMSKTCSEPMIDRNAQMRIVGANSGSVL